MYSVLEVTYNFGMGENTIHPVLIWDENEMGLIDCGFPGFFDLIAEVAREKGLEIERLTKLMVTHHDFDHIGALAEFKKQLPQLEILSSEIEEKYINGSEKSLRLQQAEALFHTLPEDKKPGALNFHKMLESIQTVPVDKALKDGDYFPWGGGIRVIATPGHMPGHLSYYLEESKTLVSGDALVVEDGALCIANPQYTLDMEEAKRSIKKLLTYDVEAVVAYHGGLFKGDVKSALEAMLI